MRAHNRAWIRLFAVQSAWNYERMLGIGMANAAEPLLETIESDSARDRARARAADFFNSHPYLTGLALGATVRAEIDGAPGDQIQRLRAALCSPLGSLGDQLFWTGILPALSAATIIMAVLTQSVWPLAVFLVSFNALRIYVSRWALRTGLATGLQVGQAIAGSRLRHLAGQAPLAAALLVGLAVPIATGWLLTSFSGRSVGGTVLLAVAGIAASRVAGPRYAAPRFTLLAMGLAFLYYLVTG